MNSNSCNVYMRFSSSELMLPQDMFSLIRSQFSRLRLTSGKTHVVKQNSCCSIMKWKNQCTQLTWRWSGRQAPSAILWHASDQSFDGRGKQWRCMAFLPAAIPSLKSQRHLAQLAGQGEGILCLLDLQISRSLSSEFYCPHCPRSWRADFSHARHSHLSLSLSLSSKPP